MQYILYLMAIAFLYINYKIIISDLKFKIIPNKLLVYLLMIVPVYYVYIFFSFPEINYIMFVLQIFITLFVSFILYYFGIWAAWDAKYLLVLSLFIPYIGVVAFIWNIALVTIAYLIGYFLWFYFGKCLFQRSFARDLWKNVVNDLREKWKVYKNNKGGNNLIVILKWIVVFLIIFVSIRLSRIYLLNWVFENAENFSLLKNIVENYWVYLIVASIIIFLIAYYLIVIIINRVKSTISKIFKTKQNNIETIFILILFVGLNGFILWEFFSNKEEITSLLIRVFTLYIAIYIIFKILFYSYKITFGIAETNYINIKDLKEGDIVDKEFLVNAFGTQYILWHYETESIKHKKDAILFPSPKKFFNNISRTIDKEELEIIKKCYDIVNLYHKNRKTKWYSNTTKIKILNTFSFSPYIILWFMITFFLEDKIFKIIISMIVNLIKSFY